MLKAAVIANLMVLAFASVAIAEQIDPAQAIAQKFSEASDEKPAAAAKSAAVPERPSLDYEMDMLRRARAEELERQKQVTQAPPAKIAQPAANAPSAAVAKSPPPLPPVQPPAPKAATNAAVPTLSEAPAAKPVPAAVTPAPEPQPAMPPHDDDGSAVSGGPRASVLLVLDTDDNDGTPVKPDPIICFDQQCWVSGGLDAPAQPMSRTAALALKSTEAVTSDSCSGKSACAFRNVALSSNAPIEVVEVGESRGVADGSYTVVADKSCHKDGGDLVCGNALVTHAFRMWVVPEAMAEEVGASKLEDAIADGLPDEDEEATNDK